MNPFCPHPQRFLGQLPTTPTDGRMLSARGTTSGPVSTFKRHDHVSRSGFTSLRILPEESMCNAWRSVAIVGALSIMTLGLSACSSLGNFADSLFGPGSNAAAPASHGSDSSTTQVASDELGGTHSDTASSDQTLSDHSQNDLAQGDLSARSLSDSALSDLSPTVDDDMRAGSLPGLEVTWKIPEDPAPSFVIYYGESSEMLESRIEIATARLETVEDPALGKLYRYVVQGVPEEGPLFVAVAAFDGVTEGPRSDAMQVSTQ